MSHAAAAGCRESNVLIAQGLVFHVVVIDEPFRLVFHVEVFFCWAASRLARVPALCAAFAAFLSVAFPSRTSSSEAFLFAGFHELVWNLHLRAAVLGFSFPCLLFDHD